MNVKSQIIRLMIKGLVVFPAKVLFWVASGYAIILALNLASGPRPIAQDTAGHLAASLGFAILGCSLVMCGAALARNPDEPIAAHQASRLAALEATSEGLMFLAVILGVGTFLTYSNGDSSSGLRLGIGCVSSILCLWIVGRLEKKSSSRGRPPSSESRRPEE
jgi:hypothetical protein